MNSQKIIALQPSATSVNGFSWWKNVFSLLQSYLFLKIKSDRKGQPEEEEIIELEALDSAYLRKQHFTAAPEGIDVLVPENKVAKSQIRGMKPAHINATDQQAFLETAMTEIKHLPSINRFPAFMEFLDLVKGSEVRIGLGCFLEMIDLLISYIFEAQIFDDFKDKLQTVVSLGAYKYLFANHEFVARFFDGANNGIVLDKLSFMIVANYMFEKFDKYLLSKTSKGQLILWIMVWSVKGYFNGRISESDTQAILGKLIRDKTLCIQDKKWLILRFINLREEATFQVVSNTILTIFQTGYSFDRKTELLDHLVIHCAIDFKKMDWELFSAIREQVLKPICTVTMNLLPDRESQEVASVLDRLYDLVLLSKCGRYSESEQLERRPFVQAELQAVLCSNLNKNSKCNLVFKLEPLFEVGFEFYFLKGLKARMCHLGYTAEWSEMEHYLSSFGV